MKQYCRYCIHLCVNNVPYCGHLKQARSVSSCKSVNHCKFFDFADCEPEYQDAFGETDGYKPRASGPRFVRIEEKSLFEEVEG